MGEFFWRDIDEKIEREHQELLTLDLGCGSYCCLFGGTPTIGNRKCCTCLDELPEPKRFRVYKAINQLKAKIGK